MHDFVTNFKKNIHVLILISWTRIDDMTGQIKFSLELDKSYQGNCEYTNERDSKDGLGHHIFRFLLLNFLYDTMSC